MYTSRSNWKTLDVWQFKFATFWQTHLQRRKAHWDTEIYFVEIGLIIFFVCSEKLFGYRYLRDDQIKTVHRFFTSSSFCANVWLFCAIITFDKHNFKSASNCICMSGETCDNAQLLTQDKFIAVCREHFHLTSSLRQSSHAFSLRCCLANSTFFLAQPVHVFHVFSFLVTRHSEESYSFVFNRETQQDCFQTTARFCWKIKEIWKSRWGIPWKSKIPRMYSSLIVVSLVDSKLWETLFVPKCHF